VIQQIKDHSFGKLLLILVILAISFSTVRAEGPAPDRPTAFLEINFMEMMIEHHHMAVEMGKTCQEKATHEELQKMCTGIIKSQEEEITKMHHWLQLWYGLTHMPMPDPTMEKQMQRMHSLEGREFEIHFMETMVMHHRQAVAMGAEIAARAFHRELRVLGQNVVRTQSMEIEKMERWLCRWYRNCEHARMPFDIRLGHYNK
jgi:uncharacterized protein (DUF305 family)